MRTSLTNLVYLAVLVAGLLIGSAARAEYRVFVLKIDDSTTGQSRTVMTTLDHLQYAEYYPTLPTERVSIQETWKCLYYRSDVGQDGAQSYCPNPRAPASAPLNHGGYGGSYGSGDGQAAGGLGKATFSDPNPAKTTAAQPPAPAPAPAPAESAAKP